MGLLTYEDGSYRTVPQRVGALARILPGLSLYLPFVGIVLRASRKAKRGRYDDEAFAWGVNSMLRWDGASWLPCPSPGDVYAMHGARRDLTFAVGRQGLVARWDGSSWRTMEPAPGGDLIAVHVVDDGEMYAIAKPGVILEGTSLGWRVKVDTGKKLRGIAKFAGRLLVAVETEGLFELVDGKLAPYKTSFKPHQIECRSGLVIAAAEHVVRSSDGEKFRGVALKVLRELVDRHPPHW